MLNCIFTRAHPRLGWAALLLLLAMEPPRIAGLLRDVYPYDVRFMHPNLMKAWKLSEDPSASAPLD
jgi:hypothetical protein